MKYTDRLFPDLSQSMASSRTLSDGTKKKLPFKAPSRVDSAKSAPSASKAAAKSAPKPAPKRSAPAKATSAALTTKSNSFNPASKAAAVVLSSDEDSDELEDTPPKKKQKQKRRETISDDEDEEQDEQEDELEAEPQPVRKEARKAKNDDGPAIPQKLLTRLLYEGFEDKNMKIGREAMTVVGKYMETFVREALARAVYEREEAEAEIGKGTGDGFLQVEDLEKLAPQLLLDF